MITAVVQRWRDRRGIYRPAGEPIDPRQYEVAEIPDDTTARGFVEAHHYAATYVAARRRYGLYRSSVGGHDALVGVAVYSQPVHPGAFRCLPDPEAGVELGRLVLLDDVPANGESWMVARCHALLTAAGYTGAIAFSDDVRRVDRGGRVVLPGHAGTVYQALNARYLGRGRPASLWLLPGRAHDRTARTREGPQGRAGAATTDRATPGRGSAPAGGGRERRGVAPAGPAARRPTVPPPRVPQVLLRADADSAAAPARVVGLPEAPRHDDHDPMGAAACRVDPRPPASRSPPGRARCAGHCTPTNACCRCRKCQRKYTHAQVGYPSAWCPRCNYGRWLRDARRDVRRCERDLAYAQKRLERLLREERPA